MEIRPLLQSLKVIFGYFLRSDQLMAALPNHAKIDTEDDLK